MEVLVLVATGLTNQQIANSLSVSKETVKRHMDNVLSRLDPKNRAHAVAKAYQEGWLMTNSSDVMSSLSEMSPLP